MNNIFVILFLLIGAYFMVKNFNTYKNRMIILNAITEYNTTVGLSIGRCIEYETMNTYEHTLFTRFWDWGYEHILPSPEFEKIKPFIKKKG